LDERIKVNFFLKKIPNVKKYLFRYFQQNFFVVEKKIGENDLQ
jgi:hypothetical protein